MSKHNLSKSKVAIIGLGTLGCRVACILSKNNSKEKINLLLIDRDIIEEQNIQRQPLYAKLDVGKPKAFVLTQKLKKLNPKLEVKFKIIDLNFKTITVLDKADLVLDCTDNLETRFLVNDFCRKEKIPWIYSAAVRWYGTVFAVMPNGPCLRCVLGSTKSEETCEIDGIENEIADKTAKLQAREAIKFLNGFSLEKNMLRLNLKFNGLEKIQVKKRKNCLACSGTYEYLSGKKADRVVRMCGRELYQILGRKLSKQNFKKVNKNFKFFSESK